MAANRRKEIPTDSLLQLRQRLDRLPRKSPERARQIRLFAELYGVSSTTLYRALKQLNKPRPVHRADHGKPRLLPTSELKRYCELIAALKLRTTNKNGRHLSTRRAITLLEAYGVETSQGLVQAPKGLLHKSTVDAYLQQFHLDQPRLRRQPPAVHFQAEHSNDCWQFDLSPSDLKQIKAPSWVDPTKGQPTLMLFSVVDDRSGVAYMEYRCVYGEDAESALRFLFNAMAPKAGQAFPFQGRPEDDLPRQRAGRQEPGLPERDARVGHRLADPPSGRQGRHPGDRPLQGQGRAPISHRQGGARSALPLPRTRD